MVMAPFPFSSSLPLQTMHPNLIYVAKPPTAYTSLWNIERGRLSPSLPPVCSGCYQTMEGPLPTPYKSCAYGSVGDGRPNPSICATPCPLGITPLPLPSRATSMIFTHGARHEIPRGGPPERLAKQSAPRNTYSSISTNEIPTPIPLRPGELIYLATPQGPRYCYGGRLVKDNSADHIPTTQSRRW